ncbi:MAG: regulatory protein RecX [Armatimonadota bacterium]
MPLSTIAAIDCSGEGRVATVRFNDGHTLQCPPSLLQQLQIDVGTELDTRQLDKLTRADELHRAKTAALRLLRSRGRTTKDLKHRLQKKHDFADHTIAEVTSWLQKLGYLDDRQYAEDRVQAYALKQRYGREGLVAKLVSEGVDRLLAEEVVYDAVTAEDEQRWAHELVEKRAAKLRDREPDKRKRTIFSYLRRHGFEHDYIMSAIEALEADD